MIDSGDLIIPQILPGKQVKIDLPCKLPERRDADELWLSVMFKLKQATAWADAGHEIAWIQTQIETSRAPLGKRTLHSSAHIEVNSSKLEHRISGHGFSFCFDRARGYLTQWISHGRSILAEDPSEGLVLSPSFWRAPTDNDMPYDLGYWQRFGLDAMTSELRSFDVFKEESSVKLDVVTYISPPILAWGFDTKTTYVIASDGSLTVKTHLKPVGSQPKSLPRIGLNVRLHKSLNTVAWLGLGPGESYPDKCSSQKHGCYTATLAELHTPYEVPQENGNRMETRWVEMLDVSGKGVRATMTRDDKPSRFNWAAGKYSPEMLMNAKHPCDLVEEDAVLWRLDAKVAGVGSAACGPGVREEYQVKCEEVEFEVRLEAVEV